MSPATGTPGSAELRVTGMPGTIVVDETGRPVPAGVTGLLAKTGHIPLRYHNDPDKTAQSFVTHKGTRCAIVGDVARVEPDGAITVLGRQSSCINTGGEKVYPNEIESVLMAHPAVEDCLVVGVPDQRWGERVCALVAPRATCTVSLEGLQAHARSSLAGYKIPRALCLVERIERTRRVSLTTGGRRKQSGRGSDGCLLRTGGFMGIDLNATPIVSADSHVNEPHDLWFERLPAGLRDRAPRRIQQTQDGPWEIVLNGSLLGWANLDADEAARMEAEHEAEASTDVRLAMLATEGINAEVVYPTIGLYAWSLPDAQLGVACCRAYNDWIFDRLGGTSPRVRLAAIIPTWSSDDAVADIERTAARGFAAALLPIVGSPDWNHRQWEPVWSAITDVRLPAAMHQGTGHDMIWVRGSGAATTNLIATQAVAPRTATLLAASGVLERHPELHVVLVEVNAGWLAWTMHTADEYYLAHAHWSHPKLAELPSHYLRNQIHATFQRDPVGVANRNLTGVECLMWGGDYPHPETTYPHSLEVLDNLFANVDPGDAAAIWGGTAARVFGFDTAALAPTAVPTR